MIRWRAGCAARPSLQPASPSLSPALRLAAAAACFPALGGGSRCRASEAAGVRVCPHSLVAQSAGAIIPCRCGPFAGRCGFGLLAPASIRPSARGYSRSVLASFALLRQPPETPKQGAVASLASAPGFGSGLAGFRSGRALQPAGLVLYLIIQ